MSSHHTHTWSIDGERHVLSTHLVMRRDTTRAEIVEAKRRVHELLAEHDFEHVTIEVELEDEPCASANPPQDSTPI